MSFLIKLRDRVIELPQHRLRELWMLGELRASKVVALIDLDQSTRERISPQIAAAERSLEIRSSWIRVVNGLPGRFPVLYVLLAVSYVFIGWRIFSWVGEGASAPKFIPLAVLVALMFLVSSVVVRMFYVVLRSAGELLAIVALPIALVGLARNPDSWQELLNQWLRQLDVVYLGVDVSGSINNAFGIVAAVYLVFIVHRLLVFMAHAVGPREAESDLTCAILLNDFLDIALTLQTLTSELGEQSRSAATRILVSDVECENGSETDSDTEWESVIERAGAGLRLYIADDTRLHLLRELDSLARFSERQWRRSLRTGDSAVDREVDRIATGIATRIRSWKVAAGVGGGSELVRMRKAFSVAVVNIADEDWKAMAVDVSDRDLLGRRLVRWLRSAAAVIVLLGTCTVLITRPFAWVATVHETGMTSVTVWVAIAVAALLAPLTVDRVIGQMRQASTIKEDLA